MTKDNKIPHAGIITVAAAHVVFLISFLCYWLVCLKAVNKAEPMMLFMLPAVYLMLILFSFCGAKLKNKKFFVSFREYSFFLFVFIFLFAVFFAGKMSLPDPHNFFQRKCEIILGASYAFFTLIMTIKLLAGLAEKDIAAKTTLKYLMLIFFIFYFFISIWFNIANEPAGDEPIYLLVAHSIVHDGDIDLSDNYQKKDYKKYYSRELKPQADDIRKKEKLFSYHPLFPSVFFAPFYFIAGRAGATIAVNMVCAVFVAILFAALYTEFNKKRDALITASVAGLTMPFFMFVNQTGTDALSAFFLLASFYLLRYRKERVFLFSGAVVLLFFTHVRNAPACGVIGLLYVLANRKEPRRFMGFLMVAAASIALYLLINTVLYGRPVLSHGGGFIFSALHILKGMVVLFFDRQMGLFAYAPVYILIFTGAALLYRQKRGLLYTLSALFIPVYLMASAWNDWGVGSSSPRYFLPVFFIFAYLLMPVIVYSGKRPGQIILQALILWTGLISAAIAMIPWFRWDKTGTENWILSIISRLVHFDFSNLFPSFNYGRNTVIQFIVWALAVLLANIVFFKGLKKNYKETK